MVKRIYSLETEYALVHDTTATPSTTTRSAEELYSLLEAKLLAKAPHATCDPTRPQSRPGASPIVEVCEGYFLANGARLYFDTGHLEWAAPEASDPYQAVVYDRAGDLELVAATAAVEKQLTGGRPLIVKNNLDYQSDVTYGCHENYSVRQHSDAGRNVMRRIVDCLVPFLVTRQLLCGAGRLGASRPPYVAFQLSQRADFITDISSVKTREDRPIVNLRDEPLADETNYARLHLILGDSNMAEYSAFLKLGTTGILLDMIEADVPLPDLALSRPEDALHQVSRDLEFSRRFHLEGGGSETALGMQRAYWQSARDFLSRQRDVEPWAQRVVQMWGETLTIIGEHRGDVESRLDLDWAIKRSVMGEVLKREDITWDELSAWEPVLARTWKLALPQLQPSGSWDAWLRKGLSVLDWTAIEMWRQEHKLDWSGYPRVRNVAAKLRAIDIRYHDIDPRRGLFYRWGLASRVTNSDAELEAARHQAPQDTRAAVRAHAIRLASERGEEIRVDWDRVHLVHSNRDIALPDPFSNDTSVLNRAFTSAPQPPLIEEPLGHPAGKSDRNEIEIVILNIEELSDADKQ